MNYLVSPDIILSVRVNLDIENIAVTILNRINHIVVSSGLGFLKLYFVTTTHYTCSKK